MIKIGFKACRMKTFKMKLENLPLMLFIVLAKRRFLIKYVLCKVIY